MCHNKPIICFIFLLILVYRLTSLGHQYEMLKSSEVEPDAEVFDAQIIASPLSAAEQKARVDQLMDLKSMGHTSQGGDAVSPV